MESFTTRILFHGMTISKTGRVDPPAQQEGGAGAAIRGHFSASLEIVGHQNFSMYSMISRVPSSWLT